MRAALHTVPPPARLLHATRHTITTTKSLQIDCGTSRVPAIEPVESSMRKLPQVILVTGPTAVGKTAVGLELAKRLNGEVISADSVQVYRTLDIGSDKLPLEQRQGIPHHLIDVRDHQQDFSAGDFHDMAREVARDVISRGRVPIVVGGTGFYLRWFTHGKAQGPKTSVEAVEHVQAALKQAWSEEARRQGLEELGTDAKWDAGVALLAAWGDEEAAARILLERNNYYRLERALALVHMTGKKLSELDIPATPSHAQQGQQHQQQELPPVQQHMHEKQHELEVQPAVLEDCSCQPMAGHMQSHEASSSLQTETAREAPAIAALARQPLDSALDTEGEGMTSRSQIPADDLAEAAAATHAAAATQEEAAAAAAAAAAAGTLPDPQVSSEACTAAAASGSGSLASQHGPKQMSRKQQKKAMKAALAAGKQAGRAAEEDVPLALTTYDVGTIGDGEFDFRPFFLNRNRSELYDRIGARCEEMVFTGLLDEAASLLLQGVAPGASNASRAIGYRQAMTMLQQAAEAGGPATGPQLEQLVRDIITATHKLVRSQMTWFRDDGVYRWVDMTGRSTNEVVDGIIAEVASPAHQGGCGASGRLSWEDQQALKRYRPSLPRLQQQQLVSELLQHVNNQLLPELRKGMPPGPAAAATAAAAAAGSAAAAVSDVAADGSAVMATTMADSEGV